MRENKNIGKFRDHMMAYISNEDQNHIFDGLEKLLKEKSKPIDKRSNLFKKR